MIFAYWLKFNAHMFIKELIVIKKICTFLGLISCCIFAITFSACSEAKLQAPTDLQITTDNVLTWSAVSNATKYKVFTNEGYSKTVSTNYCSLEDFVDADCYWVSVIAVAKSASNNSGQSSIYHVVLDYDIYNENTDDAYAVVAANQNKAYENIIIPKTYKNMSITGIADNAFSRSSSSNYPLKKVIIPETIQTIGTNAFNNCYELTIFIEGEGEYLIDEKPAVQNSAFQTVRGIVVAPERLDSYKTEWDEYESKLFSHDNIVDNQFLIDTKISEQEIGDGSSGQELIETIEYSKLVSYIGKKSNITIPEYVTEISEYAFMYCDNITSIVMNNKITIIGAYAFYSCRYVESITIPDSVIEIDHYVFYSCGKLRSVNLPENVDLKNNGDYLFTLCTSLEIPNLPTGIQTIGKNMFSYASFESFSIPSGVTTLDNYAFYGSLIKSIEIPESVNYIGARALSNCKNLTDITIPNANATLGSGGYNFADCTSLVSITLPNSLEVITGGAFYGCTSLTEIILPETITRIESYAFAETGLIHIEIPKNVTSFNYPFLRCPDLTSITMMRPAASGIAITNATLISECQNLTVIYVPADSVEDYKMHHVWIQYSDLITAII